MTRRILGVLLAFLLITGSALAAPERITIKSSEKKIKEKLAAAQIKNINLRDIEDPAARKAIHEILNYLGVKAKQS